MKSETDPNTYSRVIYRDFDDKDAKDTFNSYNYKPGKSKRIKEWSQDIAYEERFKKKREREEKYLENFHPDDRPILLIKKKHEYKGMEKPEMIQDQTEKEPFYKVSKNTNVVDDIGEEIHQLENFIKRKTFVHKSKNTPEDMEGLSSVIKIEGIEFLPEGFLELDPILFKDEYAFNTQLDENLFREEQRKMAVLRRKQYDMRNKKKMRDVSIYVLDEHKNRIIDFLERWYFKNKRKMNDQEIGYVSNLLQIKPEEMKNFQEIFLKKKKLLNLQLLKDHIKKHPNGIPQEMRKYLKNSGNFEEVQPKFMETKEDYKPSFLPNRKKVLKRPANVQNKFGKNKYSDKLQTIENEKSLVRNLNHTDRADSERRELEKLYNKQNQTANLDGGKPFQTYNQFSSAFENIVNNEGNYKSDANTHSNPFINKNGKNGELGKLGLKADSEDETEKIYKNPNYDTNVKMYFDSEINAILDNVKGYQPIIIQNNEKNENKAESQKYIDSYKQRLLQADPTNPFLQGERRESEAFRQNQEDLMDQYDKNPTGLKEWAFTNLADMAELENILQDIRDKISTKRVSVIGKNKKGDTVVIQKLKPILIGNEYYYQTIEDIKKKNQRDVTVLTKNDRGQLISKIDIPKDKRGQFYHNEVKDCKPEFFGDDIKELVLKNEKEEIICSQKIRPSQDHLISDDFKKHLDVANFKCGEITESPTSKTIHLNPINYGDKIYEQIIEEETNPGEMTEVLRLIIKTLPDNEELVNQKIDPSLKANTYYGAVSNINQDLNNTFDEEKETLQNVQLDVKNDRGQMLYSYKLPILPKEEPAVSQNELKKSVVSRNSNQSNNRNSQVGQNKKHSIPQSKTSFGKKMSINSLVNSEQSFGNKPNLNGSQNGEIEKKTEIPVYRQKEADELEEIMGFDKKENLKNEKGEEIGLKNRKTSRLSNFRNFVIRPTLVGQEYYTQIINEIIDQDGKKKSVLMTVNENGDVLNKETFDPTLMAENYYNRIIEENLDDKGRKTICLETVNDRGERISKQNFRPSIANELLKNYFEDIVEEVVNDNDQKRVSVFKNNKVSPVLVHQEDIKEEDEEDVKSDQSEEEHLDRNAYFENLVDKFGVQNGRPKKFSQYGNDKFRAKSHTLGPIQYKNLKKNSIVETLPPKPKNITGRKVSIYRPSLKKTEDEDNNMKSFDDFHQENNTPAKKSAVQKPKPQFEVRTVKNRKTVVNGKDPKTIKDLVNQQNLKRHTINQAYKGRDKSRSRSQDKGRGNNKSRSQDKGKEIDEDKSLSHVDYSANEGNEYEFDDHQNLENNNKEDDDDEEVNVFNQDNDQDEEENNDNDKHNNNQNDEDEDYDYNENKDEEVNDQEVENDDYDNKNDEQLNNNKNNKNNNNKKNSTVNQNFNKPKKNSLVNKIFEDREKINKRKSMNEKTSPEISKKRHTVLKDYKLAKKPKLAQKEEEHSDPEDPIKERKRSVDSHIPRMSRGSRLYRTSQSPVIDKSYEEDIDEYVVEKPFKRESVILNTIFEDRDIDRRHSTIDREQLKEEIQKRHTVLNKLPQNRSRGNSQLQNTQKNSKNSSIEPIKKLPIYNSKSSSKDKNKQNVKIGLNKGEKDVNKEYSFEKEDKKIVKKINTGEKFETYTYSNSEDEERPQKLDISDSINDKVHEDELNDIMDDIANNRSESDKRNFDTGSQSNNKRKETQKRRETQKKNPNRKSTTKRNNDDEMKEKIKDMLEDEDVVREIEDKIKDGMDKDILDEFFQFCKGAGKDDDYKDSVLFSSLFYFYLDKKSKA